MQLRQQHFRRQNLWFAKLVESPHTDCTRGTDQQGNGNSTFVVSRETGQFLLLADHVLIVNKTYTQIDFEVDPNSLVRTKYVVSDEKKGC